MTNQTNQPEWLDLRQKPGFALLGLDDVAHMLGVSKAWVRDHATRRSPRIPVVRGWSSRSSAISPLGH